jgi:beta-glucosidase
MRGFPPMSSEVYNEAGKSGFTTRAYQNIDRSGNPIISDLATAKYDNLMDHVRFAALIVTGTFKPSVTGSHYLSFSTYGNTTVYIDDKVVFQAVGQSADPVAFLMGCAAEEQKQCQFYAGQEYQIRIESSEVIDPSGKKPHFDKVSGFHLGFVSQQKFEANVLDAAVEAARSSDVALVFTGHTTEWETEGIPAALLK